MERVSVREWMERRTEEFTEDLAAFLKIKSVSGEREGPYPYGKNCADMLDRALEISRSYGLTAENHEYYCGSALLKGDTDKELGIFTHLDVVEAGEGWNTPPYMPVLKDGWMYARGSSDNKGPAAASLYALRFLKENGIRLRHTVRLFYVCSEECGMSDVEYYRAHNPVPEFSFVPDASFSVCYAEKGILEAEFTRKLAGNVISFCAGHSSNSVAASAVAIVAGISPEQVRETAGDGIRIAASPEGIMVSAEGRTAHAAFPEGSENAAVKLAKWLCDREFVEEESKECLRYIGTALDGYYGEGMGISCEDAGMGRLTLTGGMTRTEKGRITQSLNIRYPVQVNQTWLTSVIREVGRQYGWEEKTLHSSEPFAVNPEDPRIQMMNKICSRVWNRKFEPYSMGGGTYARKLPNAVAFGPGLPNQRKPGWPDRGRGHQPDECVSIEQMGKAAEIYARVLMELDRM